MIDAEWGRRYGRAARYDRLPKDKAELAQYVLQVGADGMRLLEAVYQPDAPPRLRDLSRVQVLRRLWIQQYWIEADGTLAWRGPKNTADRQSRRTMPRRNTGTAGADGRPDPATARVPWAGMEIVTPHDAEARYSQEAHRRRTARLDQLPRPDAYNAIGNFEFQVIAGVTADLRTRSPRVTDG